MRRSTLTQTPAARGYARNIPIFYLFQFATGFLIWVPVWMIFLLDERGLSLTEVGLMEAVFWITMALSEVPTGAIADRFGRRTSLALGGFGFTIGCFLFVSLNSFAGIIVGYVFMAVAMTLYSGSGQALLFDSLRALGRTREYERHVGRAEALMTAALLAAALLGGPMAGLFGLTMTFYIGSGVMAFAGIVALLLREPPRNEDEFDDGLHAAPISAADASAEDRSPSGVVANMLIGFRIVAARRAILWMIMLAGLLTVAMEMPSFFVQPFIRSHGVNPADDLYSGTLFSALMVPGFAAMTIGALLAAGFVARTGERRAVPTMMLIGIVAFIPLLLFDHLGIIAAIALLAGLHAMLRPIATGYINRRIRSEQRATVLSIYELCMALQMAIIVPLISASADHIDFRWAYGLSLALVVIVGGILWRLWQRSHRRDQAYSLRLLSIRRAPQANSVHANGTGNGVHANGAHSNGASSRPDAPRDPSPARPDRA